MAATISVLKLDIGLSRCKQGAVALRWSTGTRRSGEPLCENTHSVRAKPNPDLAMGAMSRFLRLSLRKSRLKGFAKVASTLARFSKAPSLLTYRW
jgi:hypothetical protein